jgi:hypothetical protein
MKNPRLTLTPSQQQLLGKQFLNNTADISSIRELKSQTKQDEDTFYKVLKFAKFSPEDITALGKIKDFVKVISEIGNWGVTGITTIQNLLTLLGILEPKKDPVLTIVRAISTKLEQIYSYLKIKNRSQQYQDVVDWREKIDLLRTSLAQIKISRSDINIDTLKQSISELESSIRKMLSVKAYSVITFQRLSYGYNFDSSSTGVPSHWIHYAFPWIMTRDSGEPVNYVQKIQDGEVVNDPEFATEIFDPGYYLDVLIESLSLLITAYAVAEPAFRSTGHYRENIKKIYPLLDNFIKEWEKNIFKTRIIELFNPKYGGHELSHPYQIFMDSPAIPLGVIDPVSGVSAFIPDFSDGFQIEPFRSYYSNGSFYEWQLLKNYESAVKYASQVQSNLYDQVISNCGINILKDLRSHLQQLALSRYHPRSSEFVDISAVTQTNDRKSRKRSETVKLDPLIAFFAGKEGYQYSAERWVTNNVRKTFQIPMARRMDISKIQLGYKLTVFLDTERELTLAKYNASGTAFTGDLQAFPRQSISKSFESDNVKIYDVYQSAHFSLKDEESYENTGSAAIDNIPSTFIRIPSSFKERLFLNPRMGEVKIDVAVNFTFDFNDDTPEQEFIGYANVTIECPASEIHNNFILGVNVYETTVGSDSQPEETLADSMALHFVNNVLIVEPSYFEDRAVGSGNMRDAVKRISEKFAISRSPKPKVPFDPLKAIEQNVYEERAIIDSLVEFERQQPEEYNQLLEYFQVPTSGSPREVRMTSKCLDD